MKVSQIVKKQAINIIEIMACFKDLNGKRAEKAFFKLILNTIDDDYVIDCIVEYEESLKDLCTNYYISYLK